MEPNQAEQNSLQVEQSFSGICLVCHQSISPQYYFCPNCGAKVDGKEAPLDSSLSAQVKIYAFSIFLPMILFLLIGKWKGNKYLKSEDPKLHRIGLIAWVLLVFSFLAMIYISYISYMSFTKMLESSISNSINTDFGF